jgi:hypothetical protein
MTFYLDNSSIHVAYISQYFDGIYAGWLEFDSRQGEDFYFLWNVQTSSRTQPATFPVGTGGAFSMAVNPPVGKADHTPSSIAEVRNGGVVHLLPHVFTA